MIRKLARHSELQWDRVAGGKSSVERRFAPFRRDGPLIGLNRAFINIRLKFRENSVRYRR